MQYDGAHYFCPEKEDAVVKLLELREFGYHIPQTAVDRLNREIEEEKSRRET